MTRTLIHGGDLIDTENRARPLPNTDVLIDNDTITAVGTGLSADDATVIDASGKLVLPGFVDTHRHTWQTPLRGILPTGVLTDYLQQVLNVLGAAFRPQDVYAGNLSGALDGLDAGITTLMDWSHIQNTPEHSDAAVAALRDAGIRAVFGHGFALPLGESGPGHLTDARRVRTEHFNSEDQLITMALAILGPDFGPVDVAADDIRLARELDCPISTHIHAGQAIDTLHHMGLLGPDITYVHGNQLTDTTIKLIADSGGSVSVSPQVEVQLGMGQPIVDRLRTGGVATSLSIDTVTTGAGDMFTQMRGALAALRLAESDLDAADVLTMATMGGARTLGMADRIGSLRPGKQADIVLLRTDVPGLSPMYDPIGALVCGADRSCVDTVLVAGRVVKRAGRLTHADMLRTTRLVEQTRDHLAAHQSAAH